MISPKMQYDREQRLGYAIAKKGIVITAPPPQLKWDDITNYFQQFGSILALDQLKSGDILVQYEESFGASDVLKLRRHVIKGHRITVEPRNLMSGNASNDEGLDLQSSQSNIFLQRLDQHFRVATSPCSFDDQILKLVNAFKASKKLKAKKTKIVSDLSNWLCHKFPGHVLYMFGSSAMHLDLDDHSDMDLYLEYDPGTCSTDSRFTKLSSLNTAAYVLGTHPDVKNIEVVSKARVPVAKCLHAPSGVSFDLICDNKRGVHNSNFIASLQSLDYRIRPFLLTLKLWAKAHGLIGTPRAKLTSYAFTLLCIFYLQKTKPSLIPPIAFLQSPVPVNQKTICDGWDFSYVLPERRADGGNTSRLSIFQLLKGFFDFYESFDPYNVVISPLLGDCVPRKDFYPTRTPSDAQKSAFKPPNVEYLKRSRGLKIGNELSVQDPFELNFNVSFAFRGYEKFRSLCKKSSIVCRGVERAAKEKPVSIARLFAAFS